MNLDKQSGLFPFKCSHIHLGISFVHHSDLCYQFLDDKNPKDYMLVNTSSFCHQNSINRHLHLSKT